MLVYKITNKIDGKMYIGVTGSTLHKRWRDHKYVALTGRRDGTLQRAICKHGHEAFCIELIEETITPHEARLAERKYIAEFNTIAPNGYNLTTGGEGEVGHTHSAEVRERLSAYAKAHVTSAFIEAGREQAKKNIGKKRPSEVCAKISASQKGKNKIRTKPVSEETRKKMSNARKLAIAEGRIKWHVGPRKKFSEEAKQRMSETWKKKMQEPKWKAEIARRLSLCQKAHNPARIPGTKRTLAHRANISKAKSKKIRFEDKDKILSMIADGVKYKDIAALYKVNPSVISTIKTGKRRFLTDGGDNI